MRKPEVHWIFSRKCQAEVQETLGGYRASASTQQKPELLYRHLLSLQAQHLQFSLFKLVLERESVKVRHTEPEANDALDVFHITRFGAHRRVAAAFRKEDHVGSHACSRARQVAHEGMAANFFHGYARVAREWMACAHDKHKIRTTQAAPFKVVMQVRRVYARNVTGSLIEPMLRILRGGGTDNLQVHPRVARDELLKHVAVDIRDSNARSGHSQCACGLSRALRTKFVAQRMNLVEHSCHATRQLLPHWREAHTPVFTHEESRFQFILQRTDAVAERRLREIEFRRRCLETACGYDFMQRFELSQIHGCSSDQMNGAHVFWSKNSFDASVGGFHHLSTNCPLPLLNKLTVIRRCRALVGSDAQFDGRLYDIVVRGRFIEAIVPEGQGPADAVSIDADGMLAAPGLVNGHLHSHEHFQKGRFANLPLEIWMNYVRPPRGVVLTERQVYLRTMLGALEALASGATTVVDDLSVGPVPNREHLAAAHQAYEDAGVRALVGISMMDRPFFESVPFIEEECPPALLAQLRQQQKPDAEALLALCRELAKSRHPRKNRVGFIVAPSAPQRCSEGFLRAAREIADEAELPLMTHVQETRLQAVTAVGSTAARWWSTCTVSDS